MNTVLSRISAPLLVGSILAACATPASAQDEVRYYFRHKPGVLQVAALPDDSDEGKGSTPPEPESWLVQRFENGHTIECRTEWASNFLDSHSDILAPAGEAVWIAVDSTDSGGYADTSSSIAFATLWHSFNWSEDTTSMPAWGRTLTVVRNDVPPHISGYLPEYGKPCVDDTAAFIGPLPAHESLPLGSWAEWSTLVSVTVEER